jgi:hypothetical protein
LVLQGNDSEEAAVTQIIPAEHDARQSVAMQERAKIQHDIERISDRMHRLADDRSGYRGRTKIWTLTEAEVIERIRKLARLGNVLELRAGVRPADLLKQHAELSARIAGLNSDIKAMDETWRAAGWTRWIECLNSDGHIHSWFGCSTLNRGLHATQLNWRTDLSGKTQAEAIADFGPRLCSVCFPDAPVDLCRKKSDIERAARDAAKAARAEAKFVKGLRPEEQFRDARGDMVTTVAACKQVLRDAIDAEHYYPRTYANDRARIDAVTATARLVLLGRGVSQEEIGKIEASTRKRIAREEASFG